MWETNHLLINIHMWDMTHALAHIYLWATTYSLIHIHIWDMAHALTDIYTWTTGTIPMLHMTHSPHDLTHSPPKNQSPADGFDGCDTTHSSMKYDSFTSTEVLECAVPQDAHAHQCTRLSIHTLINTEWRRCPGCLELLPYLQVSFCQKANNYRALLRKTTYQDKASYASWPPCIMRK